jgi:hypothetical protein
MREPLVYIEPREQIMQDLKTRANSLYKEINITTETYKRLSKEYVEVLKEIESEAIRVKF